MLWLRAILLLICLAGLWSGPPEQPRASEHGAAFVLVVGQTTEGVVFVIGMVSIQSFDAETGLVYLRNRYYEPEYGCFTQVDPARAGNDWYGYCDGDPVNRWDPSGLDWVWDFEGPSTGWGWDGEWSGKNPPRGIELIDPDLLGWTPEVTGTKKLGHEFYENDNEGGFQTAMFSTSVDLFMKLSDADKNTFAGCLSWLLDPWGAGEAKRALCSAAAMRNGELFGSAFRFYAPRILVEKRAQEIERVLPKIPKDLLEEMPKELQDLYDGDLLRKNLMFQAPMFKGPVKLTLVVRELSVIRPPPPQVNIGSSAGGGEWVKKALKLVVKKGLILRPQVMGNAEMPEPLIFNPLPRGVQAMATVADLAPILETLVKKRKKDINIPVFFVWEELWPNVYEHTDEYLGLRPDHKLLNYLGPNHDHEAVRQRAIADANRRGIMPSPPSNISADEYPYASTFEGGPGASVRYMTPRENSRHGGTLSWFYRRPINGLRGEPGPFLVVPVPRIHELME